MNSEYLENNVIWKATLKSKNNIQFYLCSYEIEWKALKEKVQKEKLNIIDIELQFRDHNEKFLPENAEGYYLSKSILTKLGNNFSTSHFYVIGYLKNNQIYCKKIKIPELLCVEESIKSINKINEIGLVRNTND